MDIQKLHEKNSHDWSGLPENLIATISDKLSLCDLLSFSNVCKPWRSFHKETLTIHRNPLSGFPWLVMSKEIGITEKPIRCFSVLENKLWKMKMPKADGQVLIWGSFEDWLVMAKLHSDNSDNLWHTHIRISLLNPFSGAEVVLPKANIEYNKLVFSGDPGDVTCVYMAFSHVSTMFFTWVPGAKDWFFCGLDENTDDVLTDLISFNGCFYFLTRAYNIRVIDAAYAYSILQSNGFDDHIDTRFYEVKISPDIPIEGYMGDGQLVIPYLVGFRGEILLVIRFMRTYFDDTDDPFFEETYDFKVFRLDFGEMEWVKLDSLEEFCIFLGRNCTRCFSTKELGVDKGNCIYFTNEFAVMSLIDWDYRLSCSNIDDWGIFRLNSGNDGDNIGSENFSYIANKDKRTPIWLTAPLSWYFEEFN